MSTRSTLIIMLGAIAIVSAAFWTTKTERASSSKRNVLRFSNEVIPRTHKLQAAFQFELASDLATPLAIDQVFQLTAEIRTDAPTDGLSYRWIVPQGVLAFDGTDTGFLGDLSVHDTHTLRRAFRNLTYENQVIGLIVTDSSSISSSAQFHTANQDALRQEMIEIERRNAEYIKQNPDVMKKFK